MTKIPVMEIFGPTIQGEGMVIGQKTMFVRTAGCDYRCVWCDSAFTWDGTEKEAIQMMSASEIWNALYEMGNEYFTHVTLSGGNPALLPQLDMLIYLLHEKGIKVALETQGSKWQPWMVDIDDLTLSPKPPSAQVEFDENKFWSMMNKLKDHTNKSIKIVVFSEEDFEFAALMHQHYPNVPFYLQPGNEKQSLENENEYIQYARKRYLWLIDKTMKRTEFNDAIILPQLHTFVWGNQRGV